MEDMDLAADLARILENYKWFKYGLKAGFKIALEEADESKNLEELMTTLAARLARTIGDEQ